MGSYKDIKEINKFFAEATKQEVEELLSNIMLDEYQAKVFKMRYAYNKDIGYIADTLKVSRSKLNNDLAKIRIKLRRAMGTRDI